MSNLSNLIADLCPNGIEYQELGSFTKHETARNTDSHCKKAYSITKQGLMPTDEYFKDAKVTNQACCNLIVDNEIADYKYVYYWLASKYDYIKSLGQGSQTNINAQIVKSLQIPVPSINHQREIVRVLDKFDSLCFDLSYGLPAEINARKQQYEYYRDKMMALNEL